MVGSLYQVVIDCPDPVALAEFYAPLLGLPVTYRDPEWATVGGDGQPRVAFQLAPEHQPPQWLSDDHPQQLHLDIEVQDIALGERQALALGATRLPGEGSDFRVFADPSGHPFCLVFEVD